MVVFFWFKQKTDYELRISDWSSDVCSSDLGDSRTIYVEACTEKEEEGDFNLKSGTVLVVLHGALDITIEGTNETFKKVSDCLVVVETVTIDRKSVVSGQRVSVRVDLGGRSILKYKMSEAITRHYKIN